MTPNFDQAASYEQMLRDAFPEPSDEDWQQQILQELKRVLPPSEDPASAYERRLVWHPPDTGLAVQPYYRAEDLAGLAHLQAPRHSLPYVAGRRSGDNRWHIRQDLAARDVEQANRMAKAALDGGVTALGFVVALGSSPEPALPVKHQAAFSRLLRDLPMETMPLHFVTRQAPSVALSLWLNEAERRHLPAASLQGSIDHDPWAALMAGGSGSVEAAFRETAVLLRLAASAPGLRILTASTEPYHDAGASPVQELAFVLAGVSESLAQLQEAGLSAAQVIPHLQLTVAVSTSFFMEIAKLRALRLLLARVIQAYEPDAVVSVQPYVHAVTSRWHMTRYDPYVNLLRGTTAAIAAILGGCDALTVRPFDEAFTLPGDASYRLARNTQLILRHEAYLDHIADAAGGSYYVEQVTDQLAREAWHLFQQVEAQGGLATALRAGMIQRQIATVREQRREAVATRGQVLVGVNRYPDPDERRLEAGPPGETRLPAAVFLSNPDVDALRQQLAQGASVEDLLTQPSPLDLSVEPLPAQRAADEVEQMRLQTERFAAAHGRTPSVLLLPVGDPAQRSARAAFARDFFGCAGFRIDAPEGFDSAAAAAEAALSSRPDVAVICSADADYPGLAPEICRRLQAGGSTSYVVIAGYPEAHVESLRAAGVDDFIHVRSNLLETLRRLQRKLGIGG